MALYLSSMLNNAVCYLASYSIEFILTFIIIIIIIIIIM